ncbi:MAG TPA: hypothetical protein VMH84_04690 [Xanthobacteraceae bacterium]|nr:hypothetical protein [Xanthobacteraceae bacterium]
MTHIFFRCSNADGLVLLDQRGADVEDMIEAHHIATQIVREFVMSHGPYDWRTWTLHVSDEDGQDLFLMPFSCMLGKPH